jgi:predicted nucleic acid-binding protein
MPRLLLDSSVIAKWFLSESDSDRAVRLQQQYLAGDIACQYADLALYEVANALLYSRQFDADEIATALDAIINLGMPQIGFVQPALVQAVTLAQDFGVAIYDSYLVALAQIYGMDFVTADRRLTRRLLQLPFVYDLRTFPSI